jgi:IS605 OrfB family transposase
LLAARQGESDLVYRNGAFYLQAVCDIPEIEAAPVTDFVGVDLGVVNIATTSEGQTFSGADVEQTRAKYADLRPTLQRKASQQSKSGKRPRSIRRFQKRLSKKEKNFRKHTNHCISKKLVATAQALGQGLALENLEGIKTNLKQRFRKGQRAKISGWSFHELRQFTAYKAKLAGVPLVLVDARYTSQACSVCGHCAKANRRSQAEFVCVSCHHSENADLNAARNIRRRAISNLAQESKSAVLQKAA